MHTQKENKGIKPIAFRLEDSIGSAYPLQSDLWIEQFGATRQPQLEARLVLHPGRPGFRHLQVVCDNQPAVLIRKPIIRARFERNALPQTKVYNVTPVFVTGKRRSFQINIALYPAGFYAASGLLNQPDAFLLTTNPLIPRQSARPLSWEHLPLTAADRAFAKAKWSARLSGAKTDYERAQILSRSLAGDLKPHSGVPSDAMMRATPFRQYEMMMRGRSKGYCENWAVIFVHACRALQIQARTIWLVESFNRARSICCQMGSAHLTTEIFDSALNQWIWIDNRFAALGAYLGEEGPLSLAEFCLFLNQPHRRARLRLAIQAPGDPKARRLPLNQCPKQAFDCFEGWHRTLRYGMRPFPDV